MDARKIKLFTIGYPDNTETNYLLNYFLENGIYIDGVIFSESQIKRDWRRLIKKIRMRGFSPALKRVCENLLVRRKQISKLCHNNNINKVFFVEKINSKEVRDILISEKVELLILTTVHIIKPILIDIDGLLILNAHTGWLPKYRGLDCNLKALRDGHKLGLSIHKVTKKIDAGEIYLRESFQIHSNGDFLKQMDEKELQLSGKLFVEAINLMSRNMLKPIAQDEPLGKYEPPLTKQQRKKILRDITRR